MSSVGDLGFEDSCELAIDIGRSNKRTRDLPSFRPSIEETLRAACLLVILIGVTMEGSRRLRVYGGIVIIVPSGSPFLAFI